MLVVYDTVALVCIVGTFNAEPPSTTTYPRVLGVTQFRGMVQPVYEAAVVAVTAAHGYPVAPTASEDLAAFLSVIKVPGAVARAIIVGSGDSVTLSGLWLDRYVRDYADFDA
jgi:hypothetical protein